MPKTVQVEIFKFNELGDEAKEKAREWWRNFPDLYGWGAENVDSLKAFAEYFGLSKLDWSVGPFCGNDYATAKVHDELAEIKGVRLFKYLHNNYPLDTLLSGNCPFTGYCFDENLLDPIRKFMSRPSLATTFQELIDDCLHEWVKAFVADWEHAYSDESVDETLVANEYWFDERGKRFIYAVKGDDDE